MKYRVTSGRFDVAPEPVGTFDATDDDEALKKFEKYKAAKCYEWDNLVLIRVDQEEKTTRIASRNNQAD
ncbi:MAG: hypothetical protein HY225_01385 [Candidatus Vogelbacteria bacterium]|nr:hypothetical protein [Candidatus Vogelbacteria bacterium]